VIAERVILVDVLVPQCEVEERSTPVGNHLRYVIVVVEEQDAAPRVVETVVPSDPIEGAGIAVRHTGRRTSRENLGVI
jgi:hypothetical protein